MSSCIGRKSTPRPKSFNSSTRMFNINSSELKLQYKQNTPFWKKKCFLFPTILSMLTILSLSTFFTIDNIYNQGKSLNSIMDFLDTSRQKFENPAELKNKKSSRSVQQQIRRFQTSIDEIHEQEIFVPCELNNGINKLNYEILRLTDSLTRLDDRINRKKRGLHEQTAILDCIEMKGKFNKIYEDLNRISEILSMMDNNGICRCKCPLDKIINTTIDIKPITDIPFDLTTFTLENTPKKQSSPNKKTKQLKKILLSDYKPRKVVSSKDDQFISVTDDEAIPTTGSTTYSENQFTIIPTYEDDDNTQEDKTVTVADTKEDMFPEMSNAVTKYLSLNRHSITTIQPPTMYYIEDLTKNYKDSQLITSEIPKSSIEVIDPNEIIKTTEFKYEISTMQGRKSDNEGDLRSTTTFENISESTTDFDQNSSNNVSDKTSKSTPTYENNLESKTAKVSNFDNKNTNVMDKTFKSTNRYDNFSKSTTELSNLRENENNNRVTNDFKSTYGYENLSESTTELSDLRENDNNNEVTNDFKSTYRYENLLESTTELLNLSKNKNYDNIIEEASKSTPAYEDVSEFTTFISSSEKLKSDIDVTTKIVELTSTNKNIRASTTVIPMFNKNTNFKERTSSEDQGRNDNDKLKKENIIYQLNTKKPNIENTNNSTLKDFEGKSTARPVMTEQVQPKWYPVCFYPVPCSQGYQQQNKQDTNKINTVQYSAQSLNTHKKNAPPATVIQNNYPIISYCPIGMVCSMTDSVGQANMLHCMLKPEVSPDVFENLNKNNEIKWYNTTKNNDVKSSGTTKAKSARNSDEILTGNIECPLNTFPCLDDSGCVDTENWCDGRIHCNDASDESQCNCKERIDKDKLCDGYYDCPSGEDELGCFGCNNDTFSCGDWDVVSQRSTCFERKTRCDFIRHCPNGRDEDECTLLSKRLENADQIFFISYSTGYLHHNWKGNWYPMCGEDTIKTWAEKACIVESGEMSKPNKIQYMMDELNTYEGPYINIDKNNKITLLSSCKHQGIEIECAPETCGIRSDFKFNKNIDPDRLKRSPYLDLMNNVTTRFVRSKDPRVVGGIASNPGAWPWLIALYQDGIFHCGGVILSDQWVLTAAHCVNEYQKHYYEVQAGILRRFSFSPMEQSRTVTHVIVHTQYSRATMENDLAVMRLERNLEFNRWIRPVCLPDQKLNWIPFPGTICTAVGWGSTVEHGPDPDNMREVEVPILAECTHKTDVDGKEICAGYLSGGHDTCQGDSGGPLLCREPNNINKWYVAGIVSHGEGCARPMEPGVYTRVALFMDWILRVTEEENLPRERPQQYCPGIQCKTGRQCVPTKRQCDKYVDCMNAEDEQNCDYSGSQYHVDIYRSRNTDHSNFKYSKLKNADVLDNDVGVNVTMVTMMMTTTRPRSTTVLRATVNTSSSLPPSSLPNTTVPNMDVKVETQTIEIKVKNDTTGLNDTVLNALRQLFDNQFTENTFSCGRITQVVLSSHRCDGTVDCEDGTDEESCDCRTRLTNMYNASAVCDGVIDCPGGADEKDCGSGGGPRCSSDETVCGRSNKCVKNTAWCDGVMDCDGDDGSDEKHCVAITNGTTAVEKDVTGRPVLRQSGMVAVNRNGVWRVRCVQENTATKIADETCSSLNFLNSVYFEKRISWNSRLPLDMRKLRLSDVCQGLYVECGSRKKATAGLYHWHTDVLVDGTLNQPGVLVEDSWVLIKRTGLNLKGRYVTAVLGGSTYSSVWISSPYEQIVRIDAVRPVPDTDYDLLHLARPANVNRVIEPLGVPLFQPPLGPNDTCYAIGYATGDRGNNGTVTAVLRPDVRRCDADDTLCFTVSRKPQSCIDSGSIGEKNSSHVTAIVCESDFGLFLAAPTIQRSMDFCDHNRLIQLPTAENLMNRIAAITDQRIKPIPAPVCHGKRCKLGKCVPWEKVCDGIPDCRDEQDETIKMCQERTSKCKTNETLCICDVSSFRCANGKCVSKTTFCNGINDCGDGTDEPKTCQQNTCVDYLKLTAPQRLCDGRWDCLDKTDEDFSNCPGYCNRTNVYQCQSSNKCISSELVCDGEEDCPESDDEAECIGLITPPKKSNEGILAIRSYGNWHAQCITEDYTHVDYHSLCKGLGFNSAVGIKKIANTRVEFENFMIVQLNARTDVTVRSATKNIIQRTNRECTASYVVCSSS